MKEWLTIRNACGAVLLTLFFRIAGSGFVGGIEHLADNAGKALGAMSLLILSACFFSRSLCELISRPFHRLIDAVYFGSDDRDPPPLDLRLADAYRSGFRYEDALAEYERQLEYHPRSPELWREMIRTAGEAGNTALARQLFRRASRKMPPGEIRTLERDFAGL